MIERRAAEKTESKTQSLLPALIEIGRNRAAVLAEMKAALDADDIQKVLKCAARLCGAVDVESLKKSA